MEDMPTQAGSDLPREDATLTREQAVAELRALIEEGLASGEDEDAGMESIKEEVRRRLAD